MFFSKPSPTLSRAGISISFTIFIASPVSASIFSVSNAPSFFKPLKTAVIISKSDAAELLFAAGACTASLYAAIKSIEFLSIPSSTRYALTAPVIESIFGLIIGKSSPSSRAIVRKVLVTRSRFGSPNEIFETPRQVLQPSSVFTLCKALSVCLQADCSAETVIVRQSINTSLLSMPIASALSTILFAISNLPSAVFGIPFSSSVRPTTQAPYFLTSGKTVLRLFSSPFTEFTIGLPL